MLLLRAYVTKITSFWRANMSKATNEVSDDNTDLLTEIAVAYYQDGATQEEISKKFYLSIQKIPFLLKLPAVKIKPRQALLNPFFIRQFFFDHTVKIKLTKNAMDLILRICMLE